MSMAQKIKNKAEELGGHAKEKHHPLERKDLPGGEDTTLLSKAQESKKFFS